MPDSRRADVSITLTPAQVSHVVRAAAAGRENNVFALIDGSLDPRPGMRAGELTQGTDPRLSRSLLRGLSLLTCFDRDGTERGVIELADELAMSPSTTHRYASTLVELGLLERCPTSRKYRLARP